MKRPISVRLELVVASCNYGHYAHETANVKLVFAFCDFPKIAVNPRNASLAGCGKSCELELKRIAFLSEVPLWVALAVQTDEFSEEIVSEKFDLSALRDDLGKPASSVPFRLFACGQQRDLGFEIQIRLIQNVGDPDEVFLAAFTKTYPDLSDVPLEHPRTPIPHLVSIRTPPATESRIAKSLSPKRTPVPAPLVLRPEFDLTAPSGGFSPSHASTLTKRTGIVGGKMRSRGIKINMSK